MKVASLFAGCGGLDLGLQGGFDFNGKHYGEHPVEVIWANELADHPSNVYDANFVRPVVRGDIWDALDTLPDEGQVDIVCGGFPCQDVSINGKLNGAAGHRTTLYKAMIDAVERMRPSIVLAENVKGILMERNRPVHDGYIGGLERLGYETTFHVYLAAEYEVPQRRERVIYVSTLRGIPKFRPPAPVLKKDSFITCEEAIGDLPAMRVDKDFAHIWSLARRSTEQGNRKLSADRPSQTIRAESHGNHQFHYCHPRRISMRESARFQSFPDSFGFFGGIRALERMIGNAVPPVLGWHLAKAIVEQYS